MVEADHNRLVPWYLGPHFLLTLMLAVVILGYSIGQSLFPVYVLRTVITLLLLSAFYAVSHTRWVFRILLLLLVPLSIATWLVEPLEFRTLSLFSTATTMLYIGDIGGLR